MSHDPEVVFQFIVKFKKEHDGNSPAIREIGAACDISSTSAVVYILKTLVRQGRIKLWGTRGITVTNAEWRETPC
jgi:hypothetical protein